MTAKKPQETAQPVEQPVNNDCFIIMPIAENDGYNQGHFKRVYEDIFAPACRAAGYKPVRADDVAQTNLIQLDILQKLLESPMAICDLSTRNPNVLFELGLRQAFDKPTILVQEEGTPAIFDISMFRYTTYSKTLDYRQVLADQERIKCVLEETRNAVGDGKSINSVVKLLSITEAKLEDTSNFGEKEYFQILMAELKSIKKEMTKNIVIDQRSISNENIFDIDKNIDDSLKYRYTIIMSRDITNEELDIIHSVLLSIKFARLINLRKITSDSKENIITAYFSMPRNSTMTYDYVQDLINNQSLDNFEVLRVVKNRLS